MIKIGDVIKLETGEHAVVLKTTKNKSDMLSEHTFISVIKGNGDVQILNKDKISQIEKTKHTIPIENVLSTLQMFDRAAK